MLHSDVITNGGNMRFLHTSDWHLGRYFYERELQEDQEFFLNQVYNILSDARDKNMAFSAILVSGDIYDKSVPTVNAVKLFSNFLKTINEKFPELHLFFIAGNHDNPSRLTFAKEILKKDKIHIVGDTDNYTTPVVLKNNSEEVCVYQLPFLYPLKISGNDETELLRDQEEMYKRAASNILTRHKIDYGDTPAILQAHLFVGNSTFGASERSCVGTAQKVSVDIFSGFAYGAFGHIHKMQKLDSAGRIWYSGSPLAYDFDDNADTYMLDVNITGSECLVKKIAINPLHKIATIKKKFSDIYSDVNKDEFAKYNNCYVRVINDDNTSPIGAMQLLKQKFPYILSFQTKLTEGANFSSTIGARRDAIESHSPKIIFERFISDAYGVENYCQKLTDGEKLLFDSEESLYLKYNAAGEE